MLKSHSTDGDPCDLLIVLTEVTSSTAAQSFPHAAARGLGPRDQLSACFQMVTPRLRDTGHEGYLHSPRGPMRYICFPHQVDLCERIKGRIAVLLKIHESYQLREQELTSQPSVQSH
jgi:hypothetical protein